MVEMEGEPAERRGKRGALKKAKKESKHTTGDEASVRERLDLTIDCPLKISV